ncbi:type II secretion system inner membrane protein GspF [Gimibacter soli]|uniref:General secretion pathway protein F n=1 Tax=Gimibacter soli TaxID=3024400 RepID=A0AAE9XRC2_9PROT|nr:type II secretion system inner membrane protein GspF [Gimibacter soli]WCL53736.1 type II secretion system inner membrane protein GspF [Gimibacter soli]
MPAFDFEALDTDGRVKRGVLSADSARGAAKALKDRALLPVKIEPAAKTGGEAKSFGLRSGRLSHRDITLVTRQLSTLIGAATPVEEALKTVAEQAEKPLVKRVLLDARTGVSEGRKLSAALATTNAGFDRLYVALVAAGEGSGSLGPVMERLADHLEKAQAMRGKVTAALVYPICLAVTAFLVVTMLMSFVVPKVVDQFSHMGATLPALTRVMIALSAFMREVGPFLLVAAVIAAAAFARALKSSAFRLKVDAFLLRLPLVGKLIRSLAAARLARTLATLIASGVPVLDGMKAAEAVIGNGVIRQAVGAMRDRITNGASLSAALRSEAVLPAIVTHMAAAGENSGALHTLLAKAADYLEAEFERFTSTVLGLLEPAIIIVMGGIVTLIVLSILLPILQLNTLAFG